MCGESGTIHEGSLSVGTQISLPAEQVVLGAGFGNTMAFDGQTLYIAAREANPGVYRYRFDTAAMPVLPATPATRSISARGAREGQIPGLALAVHERFSLVGDPNTNPNVQAFYSDGMNELETRVAPPFGATAESVEDSERGYSVALLSTGEGMNSVFTAIGSPGANRVELSMVRAAAERQQLQQEATQVVEAPEMAGGRFGHALALTRSDSRPVLFVSALESQRVYVYDLSQVSDEYSPTQELAAPVAPEMPVEPEMEEPVDFGWSLAAYGDYLAIGAPGVTMDSGGNRKGFVYIYRRGAEGFTHAQTLVAPRRRAAITNLGGEFGFAVSFGGLDAQGRMSLVVGSPSARVGGLAYVFKEVTAEGETQFSHSHTLQVEHSNRGDRFGHSVAHMEETVFVGAPNRAVVAANGNMASGAGSVYQFRLNAPLCQERPDMMNPGMMNLVCVCRDGYRGPRCMLSAAD